jgi:excisionase family DNA binding protein
MTEQPPSPWLTIDEAADRLRVHRRTIERMVTDGRLIEHRYARTRRYHVDDVDAALIPTETEPQD